MIPMELTTHSAFGEKTIHGRTREPSQAHALADGADHAEWADAEHRVWRRHNAEIEREIRLKGHAPVQIENTFAPGDTLNPDGMQVAMSVMNVFTRLFTNQFEAIQVENVSGARGERARPAIVFDRKCVA